MATVDTSIYAQLMRAPKSVADYDAEARRAQLDDLALLEAQDKRAVMQRQRQRADQLQALMQGLPGATDEQRVQALRGGAFFDEADMLEKGIGERAAKAATTRKTGAEADAAAYDLGRKRFEHRVQGLRAFQQPEDARQWLADGVTRGDMTMQEAQQMMGGVPRDPAAFGTWRDQTIMSLMDAAKQAGYVMPDANARLSATTAANNRASVESVAAADRAQRAADAAAARGLTASEGAANRTAAAERAKTMATRGRGPGAMSATLQKELIEADDMVQQAQGAEALLNQALKLNDKAYSGFGAKTRAQVRSNLPGKNEAADATIELDNLIGTQALTSLKAIFGGNPTEGERAILLDLQASADKTPAQRKAILQRGVEAAQRRQRLSGERAKAIRSGTYLTEGADDNAGPSVDELLQKYGNP